MPTTKSDLRNTAESISGFLGTIGKTIKENERQNKLAKVMKEFQDPNKLFMNEDGTPKSDAEIAPKLTQGIMQLYQLGEDKLANSLMSWGNNMSKSFDKDANNMFNYAGSKDDPRFPKDEVGNPQAPNARVDYPDYAGTKQYAPLQKRSVYGFREVTMPGPDGSGVQMYVRENKEDGTWEVLSQSEYTKKINESKVSVFSTNRSMNSGQTQSYQDASGQTHNVVFDNASKKFTENGKTVDVSSWTPMSENTSFTKDQEANDFKTSIEKTLTGLGEFTGVDGQTKYSFTPAQIQQVEDYVYGRTETYPASLYNALGGDAELNLWRNEAKRLGIGKWGK